MMATPERSLAQRQDALVRANEVRTWRKGVKAALDRRETTVARVLESGDPRLNTMKVMDLVAAQRGWGDVRVWRFLKRAGISPSKTIGGMTARQRQEVLDLCSC